MNGNKKFWRIGLCVFDYDYKKESAQKIESTTENKKLSKAEGIQIYSIMSDAKAAFAERTKWSLEHILYRYMEANGYKYIYELTHFVTTLKSRRNCSIDLIPRMVKYSDFLSILYSKPLRE